MNKKVYILLLFFFIITVVVAVKDKDAAMVDVIDQEVTHINDDNYWIPDIPELSNEELIQELQKMSLEEKVGQMIFAGIDGSTISEQAKQLISRDMVGGIILFKDNMIDIQQTVDLINDMKIESMNNKIPLFFGVDEEGGRVTRLPGITKFPTNLVIGKQNNEKLSYDIGALLGTALKTFGFNLDFAPVLDVNSNPSNPVIGDRSFGENPFIVSNLGIQTMKGIQSQSIIPVVKHFPGHGDTSVDSHKELPVIHKSKEDLQDLELIPFRDAVGNGADMVMVGHILLPNLDTKFPSSLSSKIINDLLRQEMGFQGVIITDDMTMDAITSNFDIGYASVEAVKAGNDLVMIAHNYTNVKKAVDSILEAVRKGEISEERINSSVIRILTLKEKYQLSNTLVNGVDIDELNQSIQKKLGS